MLYMMRQYGPFIAARHCSLPFETGVAWESRARWLRAKRKALLKQAAALFTFVGSVPGANQIEWLNQPGGIAEPITWNDRVCLLGGNDAPLIYDKPPEA